MGTTAGRKKGARGAPAPALIARLGSNRFAVSGHPGLRFSPDGARIASNGSIVGLWDVASGERVACAAGPSDSVAPAFAPDGGRLYVASDRELRVLDARTLATLQTWPVPPAVSGLCSALEVARDGARVVAAYHNAAVVWESATGRVERVIAGARGALALSRDGARVASVPAAEDGPCTVHDVATGALLVTMDGLGCGALAFTPDGEHLVAGGRRGHVRLFHAPTGRRLRELEAHPGGWIRGARFVGAGLYTWATDDHVRRWEPRAAEGLVLAVGGVAAPYGGLRGALSEDGRWFADAHSGVIALRRTDGGDAASADRGSTLHHRVAAVALSADNAHAITRRAGNWSRVWRVRDAAVALEHRALAIHAAPGHAGEFFALATHARRVVRFSLDGATSAASGATDPAAGHAAVAPDGAYWLDALGGRLRCFDASGALRWERQEVAGGAPHIARDCRSIVCCPCDAQGFPLRALVLRADTGEPVAHLRLKRAREWVAAVSDDGALLALRVEGGVRVVAPAGRADPARVAVRASVGAAAFSPDGSSIAVGTLGGEVCIASAITGRIHARWTAHCAAVTALAFAPDGTRVISGSDDTSAAVWRLAE